MRQDRTAWLVKARANRYKLEGSNGSWHDEIVKVVAVCDSPGEAIKLAFLADPDVEEVISVKKIDARVAIGLDIGVEVPT